MICADGVGSDSRKKLLPDVKNSYSGYVAWRGMVPESELDQILSKSLSEAITYYVFANSHILVYPIPSLNGSVAKGKRLINFVWYRNYAEGSELNDLLTGNDNQYRPLSVPPGLLKEHHVLEAKAVARARMPEDIADLILFDSISMEKSQSIPKELLQKLPRGEKFGLAGAINLENIREYSQLGFNFLDLSSGLERENLKGYKDHQKIKKFIDKVNEINENTSV